MHDAGHCAPRLRPPLTMVLLFSHHAFPQMRYIAYAPLALACCQDAIEASKTIIQLVEPALSSKLLRFKCMLLAHPICPCRHDPLPLDAAPAHASNIAFLAQICGSTVSDAYAHLVDIARVVGSSSLSSLVKGSFDGFAITSHVDREAREYIYGPKELVSTALALAHCVIKGLQQPWYVPPAFFDTDLLV